MSRKWNPFSRSKKGDKADSHGTTEANDIEFQPAYRPGQESQWRCDTKRRDSLSNTVTANDRRMVRVTGSNPAGQNSFANALQDTSDTVVGNAEPNLVNYHDYENQDIEINKLALHPKSSQCHNQIHPVANVIRTSPRVEKKLIKPGGTNVQQPSFFTPSSGCNVPGISISDEYTDPFDAITENKNKNTNLSAADGYVEPYEAKQMLQDVTQTNSEGFETKDISKKKLYDDPWDKTGKAPTQHDHGDYDEPWDNSETLPYNGKQMTKNPGDRYGESVLEYQHLGGTQSGDSSASSSSASLAKHRMVRVDSPRHSPHHSPHVSPKLDQRLIKPKDVELFHGGLDPRLQLYSVPGGGPKYKPVDHRLIKAEPSVGERRRNSPGGNQTNSSRGSSKTNSPIGSNRGSPSHSPMGTIVAGEAADRLLNEPLRRSSSPLVQPMNVSHYLLSRAKSRSLDIRNRQCLPNVPSKTGGPLPKSASDDQLTQVSALNNVSPFRGGIALGGVTEYEEPWDTGDVQDQSHKALRSIPNIAHSRSRSYELHYPPSNMYARHGKSQSFDKPENISAKDSEYEHPWDRTEPVPQTHLESMQRFQHRQLELHPSEAINHRDFDPLIPLDKQSWFHGSITRDEANRRLETEIEGSYLVRNSESVRHNYSLSLRTKFETIHMIISRTRDGFWILGEFSAPFHSIPEMVAYYANHRLKINDVQQISLRFPVPEEYL